MVMHHREPECHAKRLVCTSSRPRSWQGLIWSAHDSFYCICWTVYPFATELAVGVNHHKSECPCEKNGLLHSMSRLQWSFTISATVRPDSIFWTAESFVTKLGMVMLHHGSHFHSKRLAIFKVKVTVNAHTIRYDCFCRIYWFADHFEITLNRSYLIKCLSAWCKNCIVALKIKVTVKFRNFMESLSILFFFFFFCSTDLFAAKVDVLMYH